MLKFRPILESEIENGVTSLSFNTSENGTITAEGEFRVGLEVQNHTVTSNPVILICEVLCTCLYVNVKLYSGTSLYRGHHWDPAGCPV